MLSPFNDSLIMGVINITPNSFSDTTSLLLDGEALKTKLNQFKNIPGIIYDFGFESTAPMNSAISKEEERKRFDILFDHISDIDLSGQWISFDTYRPDNFRYFEDSFKSRYADLGIIFNDVSGVLDEELIDFLREKRQQENFYYILGSTHIPSRLKVLNHMDYVTNGDSVLETIEHFSSSFQKLKSIGIDHKVILDPCFGFSKSFDQNWDLVNRFGELVFNLKKIDIECPWLIGISKKSFLRKALPDSKDPYKDAEVLQAKIIKDLIGQRLGHLIFRVHDPFLPVGL